MKKNLIFIAILSTLVTLSSCKKFLEENDIDSVRPTTATALNQLLLGEGYAITVNAGRFHPFIDIFTDDVQANFLAGNASYLNQLPIYESQYLWQADMNERLKTTSNYVNPYEQYYKRIKGCNLVLEALDQVSGTAAEKANLKGQALALRSYYYLMLVNLYGKPFRSEIGNTAPNSDEGVPLVLSAAVSDAPIFRSTVATIYEQIEKDINEAIPLLEEAGTGNSIYRITPNAAKLIASRIALYKGNWDQCIAYASQVIESGIQPVQLNNFAAPPFFIVSGVQTGNTEVIWAFGLVGDNNIIPTTTINQGSTQVKSAYAMSDNLFSSYDVNDLRRSFYVTSGLNGGGPNKIGTSSTSNGKALRITEAYFNRAEAYIQKARSGDNNSLTLALADLNRIRTFRIRTANYSHITINNAEALFTFFKQERRREFCFEDQRWFDIRRWALSVTHTYTLGSGQLDQTLQPGDKRYLMPFAQETLDRNPNLTQNTY